MGLRRLGSLLLVAAFALSCATEQLVEERSAPVERALRGMARPESEPISRYVQEVGDRMLLAQGLPAGSMRFRVVDEAGIQAFALANGAIFVGTPLLWVLSSEDELALVLAHEIGHVREQHSLKQVTRAQWIGSVAFLSLLPINLMTRNAYRDAVLTLTLTSFSREQELEADDLAAAAVQRAGYDLGCAVEAWAALRFVEDFVRERDPEHAAPDGIWATHPDTEERYQRIRASIGASPSRADCGDEHLEQVEAIRIGGDDAAVLVSEDGALLFVQLFLQARDLDPPFDYRNGWIYYGRARIGAISRVDPDQSLESVADELRARQEGGGVLQLDDAPANGRPSLRAAWLVEGEKPRVELGSWFEVDGRVYRVASDSELDRWEDADHAIQELVARLEVLDPKAVPAESLPLRIEIREVAEGETLTRLAEEDDDATLDQLAILNATDPEEELEAGRRIKVPTRDRPEAPPPAGSASRSPRPRPGVDAARARPGTPLPP